MDEEPTLDRAVRRALEAEQPLCFSPWAEKRGGLLRGTKVVKISEAPAEEALNSAGTWMRALFPLSGMPIYAMRVFELEPGAHVFAHEHPWEHEIYVLEGRVRVRVGLERW